MPNPPEAVAESSPDTVVAELPIHNPVTKLAIGAVE
jgi:hypothetical protein